MRGINRDKECRLLDDIRLLTAREDNLLGGYSQHR